MAVATATPPPSLAESESLPGLARDVVLPDAVAPHESSLTRAHHLTLSERLEAQGQALFRWRSFPLLLLAPIAFASQWERSFSGLTWATSGVALTVGLGIALLGLLVRVATLGFVREGTSSRSRSFRADELNTTGTYSVCRHPLYIGNMLVLVGFAVGTGSVWFPVLAIVFYGLILERTVLAEESFLIKRFGASYLRYAESTPAFVPNLRRFRKPIRRFSLPSILAREYHSLSTICGLFMALVLHQRLVIERTAPIEWLRQEWALVAAYAVVVAAVLLLRRARKSGWIELRK